MNNHIDFVYTQEKVFKRQDWDRYKFQVRNGNTPEADLIAWLQKLAFYFLKRTGALFHPMDEEVAYDYFTIDTMDFVERIFRQMDELNRRNVKPERLLIGGDDFRELMNTPKINHVLNFSAPMCWNSNKIYGLKVEVIPWMRGMVILP